MSATFERWPNGLGIDIGSAEIWYHKDAFRVFTPSKVLRVPYDVTRDERKALALCEERGLSRKALDDMEPHEANALYFASAPVQRELAL
jgi:hypothetical protein